MNNKNITIILAFITIPILTFYIIKNLKNINTKLNIDTIIKDLYQFLNLTFKNILKKIVFRLLCIFLIFILTKLLEIIQIENISFLINIIKENIIYILIYFL